MTNRLFKAIHQDGNVYTYDDMDAFLKVQGESIDTEIVAGIFIEYKNIRNEYGFVESDLHTLDFDRDDLVKLLEAQKADAEEWADHIRTESNPSIFI